MSTSSRKGYSGEMGALALLAGLAADLRRPRTTSHRATDTGDVHGLPLVVSVKNHKALRLADWCDELVAMVDRSPWQTGVIVHKRPGKSQPADWYVTTTGALYLPLIRAYIRSYGDQDSGSHNLRG